MIFSKLSLFSYGFYQGKRLANMDQTWLFPPAEFALDGGVLAFGGRICPEIMLLGYRNGIFPWYSDESPVIWFSPPQRAVFQVEVAILSKRLEKLWRTRGFRYTRNHCFDKVLENCSLCRDEGTWLTSELQSSYQKLHRQGFAMSVEVWEGDRLVGGLFGVLLEAAFFGESMFSLVPDASKGAFVELWKYLKSIDVKLIDSQVINSHSRLLGAIEIPRADYLEQLRQIFRGSKS